MRVFFDGDNRLHPEPAGMLQTIRERPDDLLTPKILADWAEERGDSFLAARIRLQCERVQPDPYIDAWTADMASESLPCNRDYTSRPLHLDRYPGVAPWHRLCCYRRGLPRGVWLYDVDWVSHLGPVFDDLPVVRLILHDLPRTDAFDQWAGLRRVEEIELPGRRCGVDTLLRLVASPNLARVRYWRLDSANPALARALADSHERSAAGHHRGVDLSGCRLGPRSVRAAVRIARAGVRSLRLSGTGLGSGFLPALAREAGGRCALNVLDVSGTGVGDGGAVALAGWEGARRLGTLSLSAVAAADAETSIDGAVLARAVADAGGAVHAGAVGDAGVAAIAASRPLGRVRNLNLSGCPVTDAGARALAASPTLDLRRADLRYTRVGPRGRGALRDRFPGCEVLIGPAV